MRNSIPATRMVEVLQKACSRIQTNWQNLEWTRRSPPSSARGVASPQKSECPAYSANTTESSNSTTERSDSAIAITQQRCVELWPFLICNRMAISHLLGLAAVCFLYQGPPRHTFGLPMFFRAYSKTCNPFSSGTVMLDCFPPLSLLLLLLLLIIPLHPTVFVSLTFFFFCEHKKRDKFWIFISSSFSRSNVSLVSKIIFHGWKKSPTNTS